MAEKHFDMERIKKIFQTKCDIVPGTIVLIPDTVDDLRGYQNPIKTIQETVTESIVKETGEKVISILHRLKIEVNQEELIKALQYDRRQYQEGYRAGYGDYQIKHNGDIEKANKQTAKYILQKWYNENKAKGDEQDLVLELAAENGVELEEEV